MSAPSQAAGTKIRKVIVNSQTARCFFGFNRPEGARIAPVGPRRTRRCGRRSTDRYGPSPALPRTTGSPLTDKRQPEERKAAVAIFRIGTRAPPAPVVLPCRLSASGHPSARTPRTPDASDRPHAPRPAAAGTGMNPEKDGARKPGMLLYASAAVFGMLSHGRVE